MIAVSASCQAEALEAWWGGWNCISLNIYLTLTLRLSGSVANARGRGH